MKFIEKLTLILYSNLILIASVIALLTIFGWLDVDIVLNLTKTILVSETASKIVLGASILFILLSIRCIFFDPVSKKELRDKQGVLLQNDNGRLMISRETIENLVEVVTKEYGTAKEVSSKVELDKENSVKVFVNLVVASDAIIKDLSVELQNKIKDKIKETTDLEVKEVNVTVRKAVADNKKQ